MIFAISSIGRSGSKFLAITLNKSKQFTILHEPTDYISGLVESSNENILLVQQRFLDHDNYGEVNSYLRYILPHLKLDYKAYIIRHPVDILRSAFRWKKGECNFKSLIDHINKGLHSIHNNHMNYFIDVFKFETLIKNPNTINTIIDKIGITDLKITNDDLEIKINTCNLEYRNLQLPKEINEYANKQFKWFIDIYYNTI